MSLRDRDDPQGQLWSACLETAPSKPHTPFIWGMGVHRSTSVCPHKHPGHQIASPVMVASVKMIPASQPGPVIPGQAVLTRGTAGNASCDSSVLIAAIIVGFPGSSCLRDSRD